MIGGIVVLPLFPDVKAEARGGTGGGVGLGGLGIIALAREQREVRITESLSRNIFEIEGDNHQSVCGLSVVLK